MPEVFTYPLTQSEFLIDNYALLTWSGSALLMAIIWGLFFRFGNFKYGIDLGCFFKTLLIIILTTVALGMPNYFNTKFYAQHAFEGDKILLNDYGLLYESRNGQKKSFKFDEIRQIYREPITYNPPTTFYVVAVIEQSGALSRVDSVGIRTTLPNFNRCITSLQDRTGLQIQQ